MNPTTINTIAGAARSIVPVVLTLLAGWGLIDQGIVDQLTGTIVAGVLGVAAVVTAISTISSIISNRPSSVTSQTAAIPGVAVVVGPKAPSEVKDVATDPKQPDVVPTPNMLVGPVPLQDGLAGQPVGLMSVPREYKFDIPYTLPNWKLNMAYGYVRPYWDRIPARLANKIAASYTGGSSLVMDKKDLDSIPDDLWDQIKSYL